MPQYQVDSERIQSSSAAVATSISQIRQAVGGMYTNLNALQDACLPASFLAPLKEGSQNTKKGLPKESPFSSIS